MSKFLPSLNALRFFESAGRLLSFTKAASELHVTQGAVSRQIRSLENELGIKLFNRLTRKIELTEAGEKFLVEITAAFSLIQDATNELRAHQDHLSLKISTLPSIGSLWLMSKLHLFSQYFPNIETRISSSIESINLHGKEADLAIRVGAKPGQQYDPRLPTIDLVMVENWRGILAEELAPDIFILVYSPNILEIDKPLTDRKIFETLPLIHTTSREDAWPGWKRYYNLEGQSKTPRIEFGHFFMSLDAARQGLGVALIPQVILVNSNLQGLHCANNYQVHSAGEYYLLSLAEQAEKPHIAAFRTWVKKEFKKNLMLSMLSTHSIRS